MQGRIAVEGELSGRLSSGEELSGALSAERTLAGGLTTDGKFSGTLTAESTLQGGLSISSGDVPLYTGPYVFTPTDDAQTVQVSGKKATENITINPIPSNYGRITWNGATLTVS